MRARPDRSAKFDGGESLGQPTPPLDSLRVTLGSAAPRDIEVREALHPPPTLLLDCRLANSSFHHHQPAIRRFNSAGQPGMPSYHRASPLVTPQRSTPPSPHRPSPSPAQSGGLFSGAGFASTSWAAMPTHTATSGSGSGGGGGNGNGPAGGDAPGAGLFSGGNLPGPSTQIQWGATPTPLPASVQWGSNASYTSPHKTTNVFAQQQPTTPQPLPDKSRKSESKRKRFDDDDDVDDEMDGGGATASSPTHRSSPSVDSHGAGEMRQLAGRNLVPKRMRAGLGGMRAMGVEHGAGPLSPSQSTHMTNDVARNRTHSRGDSESNNGADHADLGKMLASLDKPHLLSLLSSLLASNPSLSPTIRSLLPLPTLEFVNTSLDSYEASIKAALPFVEAASDDTQVRPEYAWNRLRGPVAELVAGVQSWMDFFSSREAQDAGQGKEVHPATMFQLLHTITMRTIKIQRDMLPVVPSSILSTSTVRGGVTTAGDSSTSSSSSSPMTAHLLSSLPLPLRSPASPNTLLTTLLPLLLQSWESLLRRISHSLNVEGKMYGREVVVGWLRGCETLRQQVVQADGHHAAAMAGHEEQKRLVLETIQNCLEEVDQGFRREIGWCVGIY